jgi:hypothetical protein
LSRGGQSEEASARISHQYAPVISKEKQGIDLTATAEEQTVIAK